MSEISILVAEDDPSMGFIIQECLQERGFDVTLVDNGQDALDTFRGKKPNICVFDVMMPVMDGFSLVEQIRKEDKKTPILFLTAKSMKDDLLKGFDVGGDDYIKKPFSMEELIVRINAILKRSEGFGLTNREQDIFDIGEYTFNYPTQVLSRRSIEKKLSSKESQLLKMLCDRMNQVTPRDAVLNEIWGDNGFFQARSMDVYIAKLRKYLKEDEAVSIMNIRGQGFSLMCDG